MVLESKENKIVKDDEEDDNEDETEVWQPPPNDSHVINVKGDTVEVRIEPGK